MRIILFLLLGIFWVLTPARAADDRYLSALPDIPVMAGAVEDTAEAALFEDAEGGIASALITVPGTTPDAVLAFYARALPRLGWQGTGKGHYTRGTQVLRLKARALPDGGAALSFERVEKAAKP